MSTLLYSTLYSDYFRFSAIKLSNKFRLGYFLDMLCILRVVTSYEQSCVSGKFSIVWTEIWPKIAIRGPFCGFLGHKIAKWIPFGIYLLDILCILRVVPSKMKFRENFSFFWTEISHFGQFHCSWQMCRSCDKREDQISPHSLWLCDWFYIIFARYQFCRFFLFSIREKLWKLCYSSNT